MSVESTTLNTFPCQYLLGAMFVVWEAGFNHHPVMDLVSLQVHSLFVSRCFSFKSSILAAINVFQIVGTK